MQKLIEKYGELNWMVVYSDTLHNMWGRMYAGGVRNPGVRVSLPLHNVWERMYAGRGKSWGVPTSA